MSLDFVVQDRMSRQTFWKGEPRDCGLATKGQYCCLDAWTLDCSLSSIPAVNSISDFLHCFSSVSLNTPPPLILLHSSLDDAKKWNQNVQWSPPASALPFSFRPFHFIFLRSPQGPSLCCSPSEGMQYCWPSAYWPDSIDIFCVMYSIILLLMTDKNILNFFLFLLHFIYIHKYIYIKMFTIRFKKIFLLFSEWFSERRVGNSEMLQKGCRCDVLVV